MIKSTRFSRPSPTRVNPRTAPPLKATTNPAARELLAHLVVLTLALTEIHIPMYPDAIEVTPPSRNAPVMKKVPLSGSTMVAIIMANTTMNMQIDKYSVLRKVSEPSEINLAISSISLNFYCGITVVKF